MWDATFAVFLSIKDYIQINLHWAVRSFIQVKPKKGDNWCKTALPKACNFSKALFLNGCFSHF